MLMCCVAALCLHCSTTWHTEFAELGQQCPQSKAGATYYCSKCGGGSGVFFETSVCIL